MRLIYFFHRVISKVVYSCTGKDVCVLKYCVLLFSFVPSHASTFNKTQPAETKNVNIERDDATLKSMKPIQFSNNNCFCVCAIYIMHTAFMYVSMIWKEKVYIVKYDTAERLSSKHQALLMFYLFLWYLLCSMIYFAKYRATGPGIQIQCDHCCFEACVCSVSVVRILKFDDPIRKISVVSESDPDLKSTLKT